MIIFLRLRIVLFMYFDWCGHGLNTGELCKCKIYIQVLGEGVSARFKKGNEDSDESLSAREVREKEFKKCLNFLKVKNFEIYKNHCTKFDKYPLSDFVKIIENRIIKFKPDIIVTHNPFDTNIDHKVTYEYMTYPQRDMELVAAA